MQKQDSVITQTAKGIVEELAESYGVGVPRMYQILEQDTYNRTKKLIRRIALIDPERARIIKAAEDAFWMEVLGSEIPGIDAATLCRETFEGIQAKIENRSRVERLQEAREARAAWDREIASLEEIDGVRVDYAARQSVDYRN